MSQKGRARSRAGCLTCRKRHIRCDEQRPTCQKCLVGNRSCHYPLAIIPLRDRRMMQKNAFPPGQQAPWALVAPQSTIIDPFDTLPVNMPFKSRELYHYSFAVAPLDPKNDCIALATLDEHALRSTFLIAAVHYSWNTANLQVYESAYLFHKVESIRLINTWLATYDVKRFVVCVRQILTICLAEACLGNLATAETHLDGVMALFDTHDAMIGNTVAGTVGDNGIDGELANHYFLLISCFVLTLKSRLGDFIMFRATHGLDGDTNDSSSSEQAIKLYQKWHGMEYAGLETRLKAMRMFPYFFSPPPLNVPRSKRIVVDAVPIIGCLANITNTLDQARPNETLEQHMHHVWNDGGPTRLLLVLVTSHVSCFLADDEPSFSRNHQTSWGGIMAAVELYMHSVLGIMNNGAPIECRLLYRILRILQRDIEETRHDILTLTSEHKLLQSLWFWKVFTGVMAIARSQHADNLVPLPLPCPTVTVDPAPRVECSCSCSCSSLCQERLQSVYNWFRDCARSWSVLTGTTAWDDAEAILAEITWPRVLHGQGRQFVAGVWGRVFL